MDKADIKSLEYVIIASCLIWLFTCILLIANIKFELLTATQGLVFALTLDAITVIVTMVVYKIKTRS